MGSQLGIAQRQGTPLGAGSRRQVAAERTWCCIAQSPLLPMMIRSLESHVDADRTTRMIRSCWTELGQLITPRELISVEQRTSFGGSMKPRASGSMARA